MRDYGSVSPSYWNGQTGREIRAMGQAAQLVGVYLLTCPHSNLIGLYYLPLALLAHETNCGLEEAHQIMKALADLDWAYYDCGSETVWVRNMAFYQVAEEVKRTDKRWPAVVRELVSNSKSPFFSRFVDVYRVPFNLAEALEAPSEPLGSPSQAPSKGLKRAARKQRQAHPEVADIPPENHQKPLGSPLEAPLEALGSPSDARSIEHRAEALSIEQKQNAPEAPPPSGPASDERNAAAASLIPGFLERSLKDLGVAGQYPQQLFSKLGSEGLQCAIYKLRTKAPGRNPPGLLLTRGKELAEEGLGLLREAVSVALQGAPEAFKDPRWGKVPVPLAMDLEVQEAWAKWIRTETAMFDAAGGAGAEEMAQTERGTRRHLIQLMQDHHPTPEVLAQEVGKVYAALPPSGMPAPALKLVALSMALGLTQPKQETAKGAKA